jgi:internalin A
MIHQTLSEIKHMLKASLPELESSLNPPASPEKIKWLEKQIGQSLPEDFKVLYRLHNGESKHVGLFFGLPFISLDEVYDEWKNWAAIVGENSSLDNSIISFHTGYIKENYASKHYIPISKDHGGNNIGIDLDPDDKGMRGQVINFGRDENTRYVIANSIGDFLQFILFHLKAGNYLIQEEDGDKIFLLKEPANSHFLDTLKNLPLPFGQAVEQKDAADETQYNAWYESLNDEWKQIVDTNTKNNGGFEALGAVKIVSLLKSNVHDITPIEKFSGLRELILSGNPVKDISSLRNLKDLKKLYLAQTQVTNIEPLAELANLTQLSLYRLQITDVSCLAKLKKLKSLSIEQTNITSLQSVTSIKSLTELDISKNNFDSFEQLAALTKLTELNLANTNVADLSFIRALKNLEQLKIYETNVTDFTPLKSLEKLNWITCGIKDFFIIKDLFTRKIRYGISGEMTEDEKKIWLDYHM